MATGGGVTTLKLDSVVLAAGAGTRFGGEKLTAPWRDGVLLDGALGAAFAAPARSIVVVWGADPAVCAAADAFARRRGQTDRLRLLQAADYADGLSASLKAGVRALAADSDGVFVFLGDMPHIPHSIAPALADALAAGAAAAAPIMAGRRGHPALIGKALMPRLLTLSGDKGAGGLLTDLGAALALVATDDSGVLIDVDRPPDLGEAG